MKDEIRKKCAEAIVISDQKCVISWKRLSLGEMAEIAAIECMKTYFREMQKLQQLKRSKGGSSDGN